MSQIHGLLLTSGFLGSPETGEASVPARDSSSSQFAKLKTFGMLSITVFFRPPRQALFSHMREENFAQCCYSEMRYLRIPYAHGSGPLSEVRPHQPGRPILSCLRPRR